MDNPISVVLGPNYHLTMYELWKRVNSARSRGPSILIIEVSAPINSEILEVAIETGSLYLIGVRAKGGTWNEFAPDNDRSHPGNAGPEVRRLPGSRWIMAGGLRALSTYNALQLPWLIERVDGATGNIPVCGRPNDLIRLFLQWDGAITGHHIRTGLCALIFVVSEALRFRSIENACSDWAWSTAYREYRQAGGGEGRPGAADVVAFQPGAFIITKDMLETVQNWRSKALAHDPNVWTTPPDIPNPLIG